jgi:hypothetical protein
MTAADHYVLNLALTQYEYTNNPQVTIPIHDEHTRESIRSLRSHNFLKPAPLQNHARAANVELTLIGISVARNLPATPTGEPLPYTTRSTRIRFSAKQAEIDHAVLQHMLSAPTMPRTPNDIAHELAPGHDADQRHPHVEAVHKSLKRLINKGFVERDELPRIGDSDPEVTVFVPTLKTVENHLRVLYPDPARYEAAKRRIYRSGVVAEAALEFIDGPNFA